MMKPVKNIFVIFGTLDALEAKDTLICLTGLRYGLLKALFSTMQRGKNWKIYAMEHMHMESKICLKYGLPDLNLLYCIYQFLED